MNEVTEKTEAALTTGIDLVTRWGLKVLGAVLVLIVGWIVAGWIRRACRRSLERSKVEPTLVPFLSQLFYYATLVFVAVAVLGLFGIPTASFVAVLGATGLAVALAFQGTLANLSSGVMLLFFRPFRVGDFVEIADTSGTVTSVDVFSTTMNTPDNVRILVPNAKIWGEIIKNYAANPTRRCDLVIGISYDDDIPRAMEVIREVVEADERVLAEPATVLAVGELADSSVNLLVRPWCARENYWDLKWDLQQRLKVALEEAGCSIPYPQRDVHLIGESEN